MFIGYSNIVNNIIARKTKYQPSYTFMPKQIERPTSKLHNDQVYASKYDVNCTLKENKSFMVLGFHFNE